MIEGDGTTRESARDALADEGLTPGSVHQWNLFDPATLRAARNRDDFLTRAATDEQLSEIANGPLLRLYSKATEHEYSPQLRRNLLAEAYARHRADIESALAMVERAAETAPLLRKALDRAEAES